MKQIKKLIKKSFNLVGLNISKIQKNNPLQTSSPLLYHQIDILLDVGANIGQYALSTREMGFRNKIVSFEPLPEAHKILVENSKNDGNWIVHERCAVGSAIGETEINISKNSQSSSLLPMLPAHSIAAPDSIYIGKKTTKVITIDSIYDEYRGNTNERTFLKIDTQGFEKQVLDGAKNSIKHIKAVQLELSIIPLYETQCLYEYFFQYFKNHAFVLWSLIPGFTDPGTGQMLQFDAIFVRQS
jgi:FkbM family methyltransferase